MRTDLTLKSLFKSRGQDLVCLTGDHDATVVSTDTIELQEIRRSVDCVIHLDRHGEDYYRHIEFQTRNDPQMAERCFRYNSMLLLALHRPVVTTVLYVSPPGPADAELVYRVVLGGKEVNAWRFEVVRLWEIDASVAFEDGSPGLLALVPLMAGGDLEAADSAVQEIRNAFPGERMSDPEAILWLLAEGRYTGEELARFLGRRRMDALTDLIIQSPLWKKIEAEQMAKIRSQGLAQGLDQGRLEAQRSVCLSLVRKHRPDLLEEVTSRLQSCTDPGWLEACILAASDRDEAALSRLLKKRG